MSARIRHITHITLGWLVCCWASIGTPTPLIAQDEPPEGVEVTGAFEVTGGAIGEDLFMQTLGSVRLRFGAPGFLCEVSPASAEFEPSCRTGVEIIAQAPLRLRLRDDPPEQDGVIRRRDWDERSDVLRVIRRIEYGSVGEPVHLRLGEIGPATLGQGSALFHYFNVLNLDQYQLGVTGHLLGHHLHAQWLIEDVARPDIVAGRIGVRPLSWFLRGTAAQRLSIDGEVLADVRAPLTLARDAQETVRVSDVQRPEVAEATRTEILGATARYWVVWDEDVRASVFGAIHWHPDVGGRGEELGFDLSFGAGEWLRTKLDASFQAAHGGYIPRYVGPLYDIERYQVQGWGVEIPAPKLRIASSLEDATARYGNASLALASPKLSSSIALEYTASYDRPDAGMAGVSMDVGPIGPVAGRLSYWRTNLDTFEDVVDLDRAILVGEARVTPLRWLYLTGRVARRWRLRDDGVYESIADWGVGAGVQFGAALRTK